MPVEKFSIPSNFTLLQSLELLQAIVANQLENYRQQKVKQTPNSHNLNKTYKLLDDLLKYLNEGLYKIERYFKCKEGLSNSTNGNSELQNRVEDLQILNEDIRLARKDCRNRLKVLEKQEHGSHGKGLGLSGIWRSYSKKGKSIDNHEEQAAIEAAERIRKARLEDETRRREEEQKRDEEAKAQREKMIEVMVKEQVEQELNSKLQEERKRQRRADEEERRRRQEKDKKVMSPPSTKPNQLVSRGARSNNSDRHNLAVNGRRSLDIRPSARRSLEANVIEPQRKSLDMQDIGRAAQLAWSHSQQEDLRVQRPASFTVRKSNNSPAQGAQSPTSPTIRRKYDYVKPVLHRQQIKQPKKPSVAGEASRNSNSAETKNAARRETGLPRRSQTIPKSNPSSSRSPPSRSPTPPPEVERESTPGAGSDESSLSPMERRINKVMETLRGVDAHECEQIKNEILVMDEKVHWDDIAGLTRAKNSLKETVVYPFLRPDLFRGLREPIRGMLLFGPPGTGKTMIAKAVATESNSTFFSISASSLLSKYLGESEKLVKALFYMAKRLAPSIIFIDEIDSLLTARSDNENESSRRIKTELLIQWSALSSATAQDNKDSATDARVLVLAATNLPWAIDEAARRRFSRRLYIPLPEYETRLYHLKKLMSKQQNKLSETDYEVIAGMCEGFSGSDITALAKEAAMEPIRDLGDNLMNAEFSNIRGVMVKDFEKALQTVKKSVSPTSLQQYQDWAAGFGSTGA